MFCPNCGKQIADTAKFCDGCGAAVRPGQKTAEKKKKGWVSWVVVIAVIVLILLAVICGKLGMSIPEMIGALQRGEPLRQRGMYKLEEALAEGDASVTIWESQWDTEICSWKDAEFFFKDYLGQTPELYYVDIRNTSVNYAEMEDGESCYTLSIGYFDTLNSERTRQKVEAAAQDILDDIPSGASDWEKARLIHDALIRKVTYAEGTHDQTVYGALVEGKAVCNGYAMAYEYLLNMAGIPCDTVVGYASEFAAAMDGTMLQMDRHAWSIVTFTDGGKEKSYYVDVTWDDTDLQDADGEDYISYRWFCVTQADIDQEGRSTLDEGYDMSRWDLDDDTFNYHVYTDSLIREYDLEQITQIMSRQLAEGNNILSVRMADISTYHTAVFRLEEDGELYTLGQNLGLEGYAYEFTDDYTGDGLLCLNIYVNYPQAG